MKAKTVKRRAAAARRRPPKHWPQRLNVTDQTPKTVAALANLKAVCESHLKRRCSIRDAIDLLKHPQLARGDQILAVPTVVRKLPAPMRTIIGDLSDLERTIVGLDLRAASSPMKPAVKTSQSSRTKRALEKSRAARPRNRYVLQLFVAGASARSRQKPCCRFGSCAERNWRKPPANWK